MAFYAEVSDGQMQMLLRPNSFNLFAAYSHAVTGNLENYFTY